MSSSRTTRFCYQKSWTHTATSGQLEKCSAEIQMLVEANSKLHDVMISTDGSVVREQCGVWFSRTDGLYTKTAVPSGSPPPP